MRCERAQRVGAYLLVAHFHDVGAAELVAMIRLCAVLAAPLRASVDRAGSRVYSVIMTKITSGDVLEFWFPQGSDKDLETHVALVQWQMRGGADKAIIERFSECTEAAARGELDAWASTAHGRLALILVLDQFSRSVFRGSARAYAQDEKALRLAQGSLTNGHYQELGTPWERTFVNIAITHAEGADLLKRIDETIVRADAIVEFSPDHLKRNYENSARHNREVRQVIAAFGRYPHRNATLGRTSTPEEEAYLAKGDLPHEREIKV
jgi:uncharacterized protein (DUF924 family)